MSKIIYKESDCPLCGGKGKIRSPYCFDDEDPDFRKCHHEVHVVEDIEELREDIQKARQALNYAIVKKTYRQMAIETKKRNNEDDREKV